MQYLVNVIKSIVSVIVLSCYGNAVTLEDVRGSLDERDALVEKKYEMRYGLDNVDRFYKKIDWEAAESLTGIERDIALLNQAISEFERIQSQFLNVNKNDVGFSKIDNYKISDFANLPNVSVGNYNAVLTALAVQIRSLKYIRWHAEYFWEDIKYSRDGFFPELFFPVSLDTNLGPYGSFGYQCNNRVHCYAVDKLIDTRKEIRERWSKPFTFSYQRYESTFFIGDEGEGESIFTYFYYNQLTKVASAVEPTENLSFHVISKAAWNEFSPLLRDGVRDTAQNLPYFGDNDNAFYSIDFSGAELNYSTGLAVADEADEFNGNIFEGYEIKLEYDSPCYVWDPGDSNDFAEVVDVARISGSEVRDDSYSLGKNGVPAFYFKNNSKFERAYETICELDSNIGVDKLHYDKLFEDLSKLANSSLDGDILIQPRENLMFGISIGHGKNGNNEGLLGVSVFSKRFDMTYSIDFHGAHSDYHVVHKKLKSDRVQTLPFTERGISYQIPEDWRTNDPRQLYKFEEIPYNEKIRQNVLNGHDAQTLFKAWDKPRLEQIAGKNILADIIYNEKHYGGYTINIYRHEEDITSIEAGQKIDTAGLKLIRSWQFSSENANVTNPVAPEKLLAEGDKGEIYTFRGPTPGPHIDAHYSNYDWFEIVGSHNWNFKIEQKVGDGESATQKEIYNKIIEVEIVENAEDERIFEIHKTSISERHDGVISSVYTSDTCNPFNDRHPEDWKIVSAGETIIGSATLGEPEDPIFRYGDIPKLISVNYGEVRPEENIEYYDSGLLKVYDYSTWKIIGTVSGDEYKVEKQYLNSSTQ